MTRERLVPDIYIKTIQEYMETGAHLAQHLNSDVICVGHVYSGLFSANHPSITLPTRVHKV
jgi:hypothetical protein